MSTVHPTPPTNASASAAAPPMPTTAEQITTYAAATPASPAVPASPGGYLMPSELSAEDRLRRQVAILEGRVLKLSHENTQLKEEAKQMARGMEDLTRRFTQATLDNRKAYQTTQELSVRHAKETADMYSQIQQQHKQYVILQQQCQQYQQQVQVLSQQGAHEASVYVFDKIIQTDSVGAASQPSSPSVVGGGAGDLAARDEIKRLKSEVQQLTRREAEARAASDGFQKKHSETAEHLATVQRSLRDARDQVDRLTIEYAPKPSKSVHTDVADLPQAVSLEDDAVFCALTSISSALGDRPIQIKLHSHADPHEHVMQQVCGVAYEHLEPIINLPNTAHTAPYTFTSSGSMRWCDDEPSTFESPSPARNHRTSQPSTSHYNSVDDTNINTSNSQQQHSHQTSHGGGKHANSRGHHHNHHHHNRSGSDTNVSGGADNLRSGARVTPTTTTGTAPRARGNNNNNNNNAKNGGGGRRTATQ
eukprot:PhM_4_TR11291/c0_g1_i1/m.93306